MCAARPRGERAALVSWCPCQGTSSSCSSVVRDVPRRARGAPRASMHPRSSRAHLSRFEIWSYGIQITSRKSRLWVGVGCSSTRKRRRAASLAWAALTELVACSHAGLVVGTPEAGTGIATDGAIGGRQQRHRDEEVPRRHPSFAQFPVIWVELTHWSSLEVVSSRTSRRWLIRITAPNRSVKAFYPQILCPRSSVRSSRGISPPHRIDPRSRKIRQ